MSIEAMNWAMGVRIKKAPVLIKNDKPQKVQVANLKSLLNMLGNCASAEGWEAFPSVKYLEEVTGQNRKTLLLGLESLAILGLIRDTGRRMGQTKQVIVYQLNPATGAEMAKSPEVGTVSKPAGKSPNSSRNSPNSSAKSPNFTREESQSWDTEQSLTIKNREAHTPRERGECEGSQLTAEEVNRELDPLGTLPAWIDRTVLALFVRHRRQYNKPVSPGGWLQIRNELAKLHAAGHDPNQSLIYTMAAGLCMPVAAPDERTSHAAAGCSDAERTERARQEFERGQYGASRGGHVIDQDGRPV